jgi:hypothetical protein
MLCLKKVLFMVFLVIASVSIGTAQDFMYKPEKSGAVTQPASVVKRLSYENFRNIKLLQAAIMNYGGGEAEIDRLIDQYAEASALYFQNEVEKAAEKFLENEREILEAAKKLATKYKEETDKMLKEANRKTIKAKLALSGKDQTTLDYYDKFLQGARYAFTKANDHYDRYIKAKQAPPRELITSIYYYRRVKESIVNIAMVDMANEQKKVDEEKTNFKYRGEEYKYKEEKKKAIRKKFDEKYQKEIDDNNNKVYESKEKHN